MITHTIYSYQITFIPSQNYIGQGYIYKSMNLSEHGTSVNRNDIKCPKPLSHLRSINPNMINHFAKQSPLLACCLYMKHQRFCIHIIPIVKAQGTVKVKYQPRTHCLSNILNSVIFPILPIDIENSSQSSNHTLSIISI